MNYDIFLLVIVCSGLVCKLVHFNFKIFSYSTVTEHLYEKLQKKEDIFKYLLIRTTQLSHLNKLTAILKIDIGYLSQNRNQISLNKHINIFTLIFQITHIQMRKIIISYTSQ